MFMAAAAISAATIDLFLSGATCAITLYCGVKTPKARRNKK